MVPLQLHFQSSHVKHHTSPVLTNAFYNFAQIGLGASLTKLALHSICDNKTLELLGKCAVNLTFLDISRSWFVTDYGISKLLSKVSKTHSRDLEICIMHGLSHH